MNKHFKIPINKRFGKLIIVKEIEAKKYKNGTIHRRVLAICDCGNETEVTYNTLQTGSTKSCGCLRNVANGLSGTRIHNIYTRIIFRCYSDKSNRAYRYKQRGIKVCKKWKNDFMSFYNWAMSNGYRENLQIDRRDNDGDYEPDNCRWVTPKQQNNNRSDNVRIEIDGKKISLRVYLEKHNRVNDWYAIRRRLTNGWSDIEAINYKPHRNSNRKAELDRRKQYTELFGS